MSQDTLPSPLPIGGRQRRHRRADGKPHEEPHVHPGANPNPDYVETNREASVETNRKPHHRGANL